MLGDDARDRVAQCDGEGLALLGGLEAQLGVAWWIGGAVFIFGSRLALANLERVLGPQ